MNTTLDPKPTDRERVMLAEWAARFATMQIGLARLYSNEVAFQEAESMLIEFRTRYGVTGAEPKPYNHANFDLDEVLSEAVSAAELNPESAENVRRTMLKYGYCKSNEPSPVRDPEDITMKEVCAMIEDGGCIQIEFDHTGMIYGDVGHGTEFNDIPELLEILKGGKSE